MSWNPFRLLPRLSLRLPLQIIQLSNVSFKLMNHWLPRIKFPQLEESESSIQSLRSTELSECMHTYMISCMSSCMHCYGSFRFVSNVDDMLMNLSKTSLSFIRCFKPNNVRSPNIFDGHLVSQQVSNHEFQNTKIIKIKKPCVSLDDSKWHNWTPTNISLWLSQSNSTLQYYTLFNMVVRISYFTISIITSK